MAIHHTKKKKALDMVAKGEDAVSYMNQEGFTEAEVTEVLTAAANGEGASQSKPEAKEANHFEEWRCEIKLIPDGHDSDGKQRYERKAEKLKLLRKVVKISEAEAQTLNHGALYSPRTDYTVMYFRPEEGA